MTITSDDVGQGKNDPSEAALQDDHKAAIVEAVVKTLNDMYVFPEVAAEIGQHLRGQLAAQAYRPIHDLEEFTQALTSDMRGIGADKHLLVFPHTPSDDDGSDPDAGAEEDERDEMRLIHYGFQGMEILSGNIGYLNIRMFSDPLQGGSTAVAAMNFLAGVDALIIDLRDNGGGWGTMVALMCSYFFPDSVHLTTNYSREDEPTEQMWTSTYVDGPRFPSTPLFVLTSPSTFSAAEEFAYALKHLGRATIVGERTRGGAHPVDYRSFPDLGIEVMVPCSRSINPVTGSNWQGTGVEPDIETGADGALDLAYKEALTLLMRNEPQPERLAQLERALRSVQAAMDPLHIDDSELMAFAGDYGDTSLRLRGGTLQHQRDGRRSYALVPLGDDLFSTRQNTIFVQFTRDPSGAISGVTTTFYDGYAVHNERS